MKKFRAWPKAKRRRAFEAVLLLAAVVVGLIWIIRVIHFPPGSFLFTFLSVEFVLFEIFAGAFIYYHLKNWKEKTERLRREILQVVIFRLKTPISGIAHKFKTSPSTVKEILAHLVRKGDVTGEIQNNTFVLAQRKNPACQLCNGDIELVDRLITCPYCRLPFHKDHLIEHINDVEERCPSCKNRLTIADLFA